ncbi:hypothetical protein BV898_00486 [Hypsibius exemplaris]|uniref:Clarin-3 n=1 Tax=Hypsibius exemplaris TaxID=2072580 RepID=A0A1W0XDR6_HYPEX|nr:hypothetical protein BV898_00486 [Hypsibius exemplaris]
MDKKERRKRLFVFATFLLNCLAIALLAAALGTDYWVVSRLKDLTSENGPNSQPNFENNGQLEGDNETVWAARQIYAKNRPGGSINFGLFHGTVRHNKGLGERQAELKTVCPSTSCTHLFIVDPEHLVIGGTAVINGTRDDGLHTELLFSDMCNVNSASAPHNTVLENVHLFSYGLWAATIVFTATAMIFAVIGAVYSLLNTTYTPVAVINGVAGLYLWNSFGIVCSLLIVLMWVILFYTTFQYNVLPAELLYPIPKFTTCGIAELGYSFWLCIVALLIFALNIVLLTLKDIRWRRTNVKSIAPSGGENLFMY